MNKISTSMQYAALKLEFSLRLTKVTLKASKKRVAGLSGKDRHALLHSLKCGKKKRLVRFFFILRQK